jgi:U32 family peptidase
MIETARPDGVLIRNVGAVSYFRHSSLRMLGDFSLNVANQFEALQIGRSQQPENLRPFRKKGRKDAMLHVKHGDMHRVHLRDRVGIEHPLRADVACRNTLFNARAQTGAEYFQELRDSGLTHYRVELLEENKSETEAIVRAYRALLDEPVNGTHLWRRLKAQSQHGVTRGTFN